MQTNNESKQNQKKEMMLGTFVCNCYDNHPGDTNEEKTEIKDE